MTTFRRILVAVKNPQAKSAAAVEKAAQLARATGATLELFHGIADSVYVDTLGVTDANVGELESRSKRRQLQLLESIARRFRRRGIEVQTSVEWDYPVYEAIIRRAAATRADLIVAEGHATRHVAPWLLRFTDWELLRHSPVPVLLVKNTRAYRRPVILAAVDPSHAFAKPTGLDGEILRYGHQLKQALSGSLHAVHAYVPVPVAIASIESSGANISHYVEQHARAEAKSRLDRALHGARIARRRRHLVERHPIAAIEAVARETRTSIVVMGAISRSGIKRALIGNTAERVLDALTCDVLVVKPLHFASHVARATRGPRLVAAPVAP